jgi:hypothetical protein
MVWHDWELNPQLATLEAVAISKSVTQVRKDITISKCCSRHGIVEKLLTGRSLAHASNCYFKCWIQLLKQFLEARNRLSCGVIWRIIHLKVLNCCNYAMTRTTFWDGDVFSNLSNTVSYIFIVLAHWHNNPQVGMTLHPDMASCGFNSQSCQTIDYEIGTCTYVVAPGVRAKIIWFGVGIVSGWSVMPTCGLLCQWASTIKI